MAAKRTEPRRNSMKKIIVPAITAATLALGGCATGYGPGVGGGGVLGGILGGGTGNDYGDRSSEFERAAERACGQRASRFGRVQIQLVEQNSRETVRVVGRTDSRNRNRDEFQCIFRSDGRIVDFDIG